MVVRTQAIVDFVFGPDSANRIVLVDNQQVRVRRTLNVLFGSSEARETYELLGKHRKHGAGSTFAYLHQPRQPESARSETLASNITFVKSVQHTKRVRQNRWVKFTSEGGTTYTTSTSSAATRYIVFPSGGNTSW